MSSDLVTPKDDGALVRLRVSLGAKGTELQGSYGDAALKPKVTAPPVDGKANAEVENFLAGLVGVVPSNVRVVRGISARDKTVFVGGVGVEKVREVLSPRPR